MKETEENMIRTSRVRVGSNPNHVLTTLKACVAGFGVTTILI